MAHASKSLARRRRPDAVVRAEHHRPAAPLTGPEKKLLEEAAESWMAARFEGPEALALELSQVLYYVACMMAENGLTAEDVYTKL